MQVVHQDAQKVVVESRPMWVWGIVGFLLILPLVVLVSLDRVSDAFGDGAACFTFYIFIPLILVLMWKPIRTVVLVDEELVFIQKGGFIQKEEIEFSWKKIESISTKKILSDGYTTVIKLKNGKSHQLSLMTNESPEIPDQVTKLLNEVISSKNPNLKIEVPGKRVPWQIGVGVSILSILYMLLDRLDMLP